MDLLDKLQNLGQKIEKLQEHVLTEEATKNAIIMPFINALGYDVFDPREVVPEFVADIGLKKGEKVDYAILREGKLAIIIECKAISENLDVHNSQLFRYFHVTEAKFAILTNGIQYRFYTDLVEANKMDEKPFLELDITNIKENQIPELKKFHKDMFDIENILSSASDLKYSKEIRSILTQEFNNPSDGFVKFLTSQVYDGRATQKVIEQFTKIISRTIQNLLRDMINERLSQAIDNKEDAAVQQPTEEAPTVGSEEEEQNIKIKVETTEEELEGYFIVKTILREMIESKRVYYRDTVNYMGVLLDNNNRKTICRLWLNGSKKYCGIIDANKKEMKHEIQNIEDLYTLKEQIIESAKLRIDDAEQ
jgi:hypothetical protein